jgi:hypothetical protein
MKPGECCRWICPFFARFTARGMSIEISAIGHFLCPIVRRALLPATE